MNPLYLYALIVSILALLLQLAGYVYFFGFFRGTFQEFKESTTASLKRLEAVFFTNVKVVPHSTGEQMPVESHSVQRSKR
ncbi:MAG TPA: hypothetical protein VIJ01_16720 [Candidatus Angelobacter sp.]